jgi:hypothetical protein
VHFDDTARAPDLSASCCRRTTTFTCMDSDAATFPPAMRRWLIFPLNFSLDGIVLLLYIEDYTSSARKKPMQEAAMSSCPQVAPIAMSDISARSRGWPHKATAPESSEARPHNCRRAEHRPHGAASSTCEAPPDNSLLFPARATTVPCSGNTIFLLGSLRNSPASFSDHCRFCVSPAPEGADSCEIP